MKKKKGKPAPCSQFVPHVIKGMLSSFLKGEKWEDYERTDFWNGKG
jgi:hypothetical protein